MSNQAQTSADTNLNHVGLTDEDRAIFRRLLSVEAQGRYHSADRTDAQTMLYRGRIATLERYVGERLPRVFEDRS